MGVVDDATILIIEDDRQVRLMLARVLTAAGFSISAVASAPDARQVIGGLKPHLVVLDLGLPGEDGFSLERWIRQRHPGIAILILTGRSLTADRVRGLEGGADDYVVKPFDPDELIARIRSILRRVQVTDEPHAEAAATTFMGGRLNPDTLCLEWDDGRIVHFTAIEFNILAVMAKKPGQATSRGGLLDRVRENDDVGARSIDYHICRMRAKLDSVGVDSGCIQTVRGVGYVYRPTQR